MVPEFFEIQQIGVGASYQILYFFPIPFSVDNFRAKKLFAIFMENMFVKVWCYIQIKIAFLFVKPWRFRRGGLLL